MTNNYAEKILVLLDDYIKKKEISSEIEKPLNEMLEDAKNIEADALNILCIDPLTKTEEQSSINFSVYHYARNIKVSILKTIDQFRVAKKKALNPLVAKQLKIFIDPLIDSIIFLRNLLKTGSIDNEVLKNKFEQFLNKAEETSFLCSTSEELRYGDIKTREFRDFVASIRASELEEE